MLHHIRLSHQHTAVDEFLDHDRFDLVDDTQKVILPHCWSRFVRPGISIHIRLIPSSPTAEAGRPRLNPQSPPPPPPPAAPRASGGPLRVTGSIVIRPSQPLMDPERIEPQQCRPSDQPRSRKQRCPSKVVREPSAYIYWLAGERAHCRKK